MHSEALISGPQLAANVPFPDIVPAHPAVERDTLLRPLVSFTTEGLAADRQLDAWREQCGSVVEMVESLAQGPSYPASFTTWKLGPFALSCVVAPAARYRRTTAQIRRDSLDQWVISVARRGTHAMRTERGLTTAPTGLPYIFSFRDAFDGERSDIDWLCLFVPREAFPELAPTIDRRSYMALGGGMGQMLGDYLDSLATRLPGMTEAELPRLVATTRAMVAACVAPSAQTREAAEAQLEQARLERVRQTIRRNLRSPTLTPKRICRLVGMSRSQLYRLFEPSGGVARYIQAERLREAHRALSDPDNSRDIHKVAEDLGFFDPSTFSRAFRREFGCTPSEVRMNALSGGWSAPVRKPIGLPSSIDFAAVLRQL